jgi:hypothetical protein
MYDEQDAMEVKDPVPPASDGHEDEDNEEEEEEEEEEGGGASPSSPAASGTTSLSRTSEAGNNGSLPSLSSSPTSTANGGADGAGVGAEAGAATGTMCPMMHQRLERFITDMDGYRCDVCEDEIPIGTVRVFRQKFTLEDAVGSHECSLEANMKQTCV